MSVELLRRTFDIELEASEDGRTLEGLCVPFDVPALVADPPDYEPYQELFVRGAFERATKAPHRVLLNFEHNEGITNVLGHGVSFDERDDGLYGSLEVDDGHDGDKALRLYRQGVLTSLSVQFKPMVKSKLIDGIVRRTSVHLDAVALCRMGSWPEAQVLAVRTEPLLPEQEPIPFDPDLASSLEALGFTVPERLRTVKTAE